jgi:hypothetical protein
MFPTLSQYNRTIQKQGSDAFRTLKNLFFLPAKTSPIKIYNFGSGSFAVVFKALENNKEIAIRCFIGSDDDYIERYRKIDNYLQDIDESWKTNIQFLDNEIKVDDKYYPVLKMDWVDGKLLNKYIDNNLNNNDILSKLQKQFVKISNNLEDNRIAHGDIQCGNIIVKEINGKPIIKLIDYDGLFIPDFRGAKQKERGRAEFQHPNRSSFAFNEKIDRFSFWVILCALEALKFDKTLWKETMQGGFNTLDNMLFEGSDFSNPINSKLFRKLSNLNQPSLNFYIAQIQLSLNTSNIEKLSSFGQESSLNDNVTEESNNENNTTGKVDPSKGNNTNQYARLKITSSPSGASVRNKDFGIIGNTPITVNKYSYINEEIKIISGTKSKTRTINEYSSDIHITFEEPVYNRPIIKSAPPTPPVIPTPPPPKDDDSGMWIGIIFLLVVFVVGIIIYHENNKSSIDSNMQSPAVDTTAVVVDTTAINFDDVAIDTTAVAVDTAAVINTVTEQPITNNSTSVTGETSSQINRSYFFGKWRDENSTFTFYSNGDYYILIDGGEGFFTKWSYSNDELYIGMGTNGAMIRHYFTYYNEFKFSYICQGSNTTYNALRN